MDNVNPIATILAAKLMLEWLEFPEAAKKIEDAVITVLKEGKVVTYDIAPQGVKPSKCSEMGKRIAREIKP